MNKKEYAHPGLFTIVKIWKLPKCPSVDEWIKKLWYVYTMEYYSTIKKNEMLPFVDSIDEPTGYYGKWNKSVGERQIPSYFTNM